MSQHLKVFNMLNNHVMGAPTPRQTRRFPSTHADCWAPTFDLTHDYICLIKRPVVIINSIINFRLWLMNEWSSLVADELVDCYCLPILTFSTADSSSHTYRPIQIQYAVQWIVDFVFALSSSEPFAFGCIDMQEHSCVFTAAAAVNWSNVCLWIFSFIQVIVILGH